jgi:CHASE3 domain sensor protein
MQKFVFPKTNISMVLAVMVVAVLFFINDQNFDRSTAATLEIEESTKTLAVLNKLQGQIVDAETGQRGYLLSGNEQYLAPYTNSTVEINKSLETLRALVAKIPTQSAIYTQMVQHISRKLAELELTVRMRKDGNQDAWKYVVSTDIGLLQMDAIRKHITELTDISEAKVILAKSQIQTTLVISRIGIALFAMTGLLAFYLYLRQNTVLVETSFREKEALQRERDQIESLVRERTGNLAKLATHLQNTREDERNCCRRSKTDPLIEAAPT